MTWGSINVCLFVITLDINLYDRRQRDVSLKTLGLLTSCLIRNNLIKVAMREGIRERNDHYSYTSSSRSLPIICYHPWSKVVVDPPNPTIFFFGIEVLSFYLLIWYTCKECLIFLRHDQFQYMPIDTPYFSSLLGMQPKNKCWWYLTSSSSIWDWFLRLQLQ